MLRLFALFANLLIALILKLGFTDDIGITSEVPTQVVAGSSFEVKVTIKKGELASFPAFFKQCRRALLPLQ